MILESTFTLNLIVASIGDVVTFITINIINAMLKEIIKFIYMFAWSVRVNILELNAENNDFVHITCIVSRTIAPVSSHQDRNLLSKRFHRTVAEIADRDSVALKIDRLFI